MSSLSGQPRPRVFVGSSSEALDQANIFCRVLESVAVVVPWHLAPEFHAGQTSFEALRDAPAKYDFAVFLFTPDDRVESRGVPEHSARDNVLFEYGLFLSALGHERTFPFVEDDPTRPVKTPSDLLGVYVPRFRRGDPYEAVSSINVAASNVCRTIERQGYRKIPMRLITDWKFQSQIFSVEIPRAQLQEYRKYLDDRWLLIVVRKDDDRVDRFEDEDVHLSKIRQFTTADDIELTATVPGAGTGDPYVAHLCSVPQGLDLGSISRLRDVIEAGGKEVQIVGESHR